MAISYTISRDVAGLLADSSTGDAFLGIVAGAVVFVLGVAVLIYAAIPTSHYAIYNWEGIWLRYLKIICLLIWQLRSTST